MKRLCWILGTLMLLSMLAESQLSVEKILLNKEVRAGEPVAIILNISNPYTQSLTVKIRDKNVLGGNGLDIQCYEASIPSTGGIIRYEDITPFNKGEYALDAAQITYQDPVTGKEEKAESNTLKVEVKESDSPGQAQRKGVTTIYRCGNMNMQSTSYSSQGGSTSFQVNMGGGLSRQMDSLFNQMQPSSMQDRLSQMQQSMSQDTQALKQQMQEQVTEKRQVEEEFQKAVEEKPEFQSMRQGLEDEGYIPAGKKLSPQDGKTGGFEYAFIKENETSVIKGSMQEGNISEITKWGTSEQEKLEKALRESPQFQKLDQQLQKQGYVPGEGILDMPENNRSGFNIQYEKGGQQANLTGTINTNGTVEEIHVEKPEKKEGFPFWSIPLLLVLLAAAAYVWRKKGKENQPETIKPPIVQKTVDYRKKAKDMLSQARKLFKEGQQANAYIIVSEAVRYYYKYELKHPGDFTDNELGKKLRIIKHAQASNVNGCLRLCQLVKFARYGTNEEDFEKIMDLAEKTISH